MNHLYQFVTKPNFRLQLSLVLVLLLAGCSLARIPFYCKIRKIDCQLRPDSKCCQYTTTTTTTTTTDSTTTVDASNTNAAADIEDVNDVAKIVEERNETLSNEKDSDAIQAEPSEIDEVVVKITGEAVEVQITLLLP